MAHSHFDLITIRDRIARLFYRCRDIIYSKVTVFPGLSDFSSYAGYEPNQKLILSDPTYRTPNKCQLVFGILPMTFRGVKFEPLCFDGLTAKLLLKNVPRMFSFVKLEQFKRHQMAKINVKVPKETGWLNDIFLKIYLNEVGIRNWLLFDNHAK